MGLKFNPFTGKLDLTGAGGGSPTGPAGGDLSGTYPNPTVDGLQGRPVSNAIPVNGQVLQYDGTNWVPGSIPSGGSGGGGVVYYLNFNTAADAPLTNIPQTPNATKELGIIADVTATSYLSPILSTASYDFLASFVTDLNVPSATAIPAGIWDFNIFVESTTTNSANQVYFKIEIRKYDGVNAPVLLATSNDTYIYDPSEITQQVASVVMPQTTILSTDRIVVYLYGRAHQNNNRLTFHFGGQYPSHTHSTMPSVTGTGVVKVVNGVFQSPATTIVNSDVSASAAIDQSKINNLTSDLSGKVSKAGDTMTGKLTAAADDSASKLNIGNAITGASPTTTVNGDIWITNGNRLAFRSNSTVYNTAQTNLQNSFNQAQIISTSGTIPALRVTQTGTGDSFVVEDSTNPDATPFTINNDGRVGIGTSPDATVGLKLDSTGIKFSDNTVQTTAATSGVTSVTATAPLTSSGGATPVISTSMATSRLLGRTTAGTGVAEEISTAGTLTLTGGTLTGTGVGGSVGAVDNAVPRADGTGGYTAQGSDIVIDDATTSTQANVAITNQHAGQTNSALVLQPKGAGALIADKPDGTSAGGNARGNYAIDLQIQRGTAAQVASGANSVIGGGINNTASGAETVVCGGRGNTASGSNSPDGAAAICGGANNNASGTYGPFIGCGLSNTASGRGSVVAGGQSNTAGPTVDWPSVLGGFTNQASGEMTFIGGGRNNTTSASFSSIPCGAYASASRYGMQAHAAGQFAAQGDAQRARFVLRCKTTTNTGVEMALDGSTTYLTIPSGKVIFMNIKVVGTKSDGSAVATYERQYAVKNVAATSSEVYAPITIGTDNAAGTTLEVATVDAGDYVRIRPTGITSETWRWVASVDAVEVAYGT
jgi:hypothetical protein